MIDENPEPVVLMASSFIVKLWGMLSDPTYSDIISWTESGESFVIKDKETFTFEILPRFFKHNNLSSFYRQLNKYGFRKVQSIQNHQNFEFCHEYFLKDRPDLLINVRRRNTEIKKTDPDDDIKSLLEKVKNLKQTQEVFKNKVEELEKQQQALCKEASLLKKKQEHQQKIIHNIMAFLANMVHHQNEHDHVNMPVVLGNNRNSSGNTLMAITENPYVQVKQEPTMNTRNSEMTSDEEQENEIIDFLLDNDALKVEANSPPEAMCTVSEIEENLLDEGCYNDPTMMESPQSYESVANDLMGVRGQSVLFEELPISPQAEEIRSPVAQGNSRQREPGSEIKDLDLNKLIILPADPSDQTQIEDFSQNLSEVVTLSDPEVDQPVSPRKVLNEHVSSMDSHINTLKGIMSDVNLNLDINEVVSLFTPEEMSAITQAANEEMLDD